MKIIIGKTSGFCHGVRNAVDKATEEIENCVAQVYCLGELVHNKHVTNNLKQKGLIFIENIEEAKGTTIIRAHGVTKETYQKAQEIGIELRDLTCPKVLKIHDIAEQYSKDGYYIFLVGIANHPETIGTFSFCGKNASIIENVSDLEQAVTRLSETNLKKTLLITQTTFNLRKFERIAQALQQMLETENSAKKIKVAENTQIIKQIEDNQQEENIELKVINTICLSTELRQKETEELSQKVDLMLIIGGKNSSNTNKLYDISSKNCKNVIFAESKEDVDIKQIKQFEKIGVMAGASTPRESIDSIINFIKQEAGKVNA